MREFFRSKGHRVRGLSDYESFRDLFGIDYWANLELHSRYVVKRNGAEHVLSVCLRATGEGA